MSRHRPPPSLEGRTRAQWYEDHKRIFMSNVRQEYQVLAKREQRITWEEYKDLRANSYERRLLVQNLDDEALCQLHDQCANQYSPLLDLDLSNHYGDMVQRELAPLLVKRLRERAKSGI